MRQPKIFISMGTPYSDKYRVFRDELESILRDSLDSNPRILLKNEYPTGSPLVKIKEIMSDCDGVLVVAYERNYVEIGLERRSGDSRSTINDKTYTTPWNHIESAMAFSLGIPLYIICERGLKEEGLIESKLDWFVNYIDFSTEALRKKETVSSLHSWVRGLPQRRRKSQIGALFRSKSISDLTLSEIVTLIGIASSVFLTGFAAGQWMCSGIVAP